MSIQSDMFLKIDGIEGESIDAAHPNEIQVQAMAWGVHNAHSMHSGTGGGTGKASVSDLSFTHAVDKASPSLLLRCLKGEHINKAVLTVRKAGGKPLDYYKIIMSNVFVTAVSPSGSNGSGAMMETVQLAFSKVRVEYQPQGEDGAAKGGAILAEWDIKAQTS